MAAANTQRKIAFPNVRSRPVDAKPAGTKGPSSPICPPKDSIERKLTREEELQILHQFDLTLKYGPCVGISRMDRWKRCNAFGLNPPLKVYDILVCHQEDMEYTECLWHNEKGLAT